MSRARLFLVACLLVTTTLSRTVHAQVREFSGPSNEVADAWLSAAIKSEVDFDDYGRYLAFALYGLVGGFLLVAPALVANARADIGPTGASVSMGAGALMLGGAAGAVLVRAPHEAERWSTLLASAGVVGLSAALAVSSLEARTFLPELESRDDMRGQDRLTKIYGVTLVLGFSWFGQALSAVVVDLALPPESPSALRAEIAGLDPDERYDRIRDFLVRRQQRRAWQEYTAAAASMLAGGLTMYATQHFTTGDSQYIGGVSGFVMIISGVSSLISYWLSDDPVSLLDDGISPSERASRGLDSGRAACALDSDRGQPTSLW